jgi:hypothetical protein
MPQLANFMVKIPFNKEERKTSFTEQECLESQNDSKDDNIYSLLQNLKFNEERAIEQKEQLTTLLESQNDSKDEDTFSLFQSLKADEISLSEQKENLTNLLSQLKTKANVEVEKRKRKVERLNSEVADLKRKTEKFARWISTDSELVCSQTGP